VSKLTVTELAIYPVKSLAGIKQSTMVLGARGPLFDRHWMVTDPLGQFLTQRQQPRMCLIKTALCADALELSAPGMQLLRLTLPATIDCPRSSVKVWRDTVQACDMGAIAADWLSSYLGAACRLHFMPDDSVRAVDPIYARSGDQVGFADGFPILLITEASLQAFNAELPEPIGSERFRPNIVLGGTAPYAEDEWRRLRIGDVEFDVVKPCSRCAIPSLDPSTAERQPIISKTLSRLRRRGDAVYFGQNVIHRGLGSIALGDSVTVLA
jgi:MOSC domain-containing protein